MKIRNVVITIVLMAMLTLPAFAITLQSANAADFPPTNYPTYSFLSVNPNPIGVNQRLSVNFWLDKVTPNAATGSGARWQQITVIVTKPDGTTETKGPFTFDAVGSGWSDYYPTQPGRYTFQMKFPGQWVNYTQGANTYKNYYQPSESAIVPLTVQSEPVAYWTDIALPSGYWTRPLNAELRNTASIASYWLAAGSTGPHGPRAYNWLGNYQPYGTAPDTAHVLWTREIAFGGSVGGAYGDNGDGVYYPGETYERKFQPPIIMQGRLYYNERLGSSLWDGFVCVDLNTGETIWEKVATDKNSQPITFGQLLDFQTPNQHGVIPYLWGVIGSTYMMYDAFSGSWILNVTGVPSGSMVFGKGGEILIYSLNAAGNYMTLWNSTRAINPTVDTTWMWRPTQASVNVTAGYMWNETIPDVAGSQGITKITPQLIYARATLVSTPAAQMCDVAYDIKNGQKPVQLWVTNRTYEGTLMNGPLQVWQTSTGQYEGVFTTFVKEKMVWYGYDAYTGAQKWGPTQPYSSAWGMYQPYADSSVDGTQFYAGGYDGMVHAYDLKTGENVWNYYTGTSGFETPYGTYPFKDNALTTADGKVFAATNEHSPNTPFFHGWRLHAIDAATGQAVWNISFIGLAPIIADGRALSLNYFDNRIYCFALGPSATTVAASPKIVEQGSSVLIEGTVTDQSPGAKGTPAIADESMSAWMEYVYEQHEIPGTATGVSVILTAVDPNGNAQEIGKVVSDMTGSYSMMWKPQLVGKYTIVATFAGSASYGSSYAQTSVGVEAAKAAPAPTAAPATPAPTAAPITAAPTVTASPSIAPGPTEAPNTALYVGVSAVVVIVVLAAIAVFLRRRK